MSVLIMSIIIWGVVPCVVGAVAMWELLTIQNAALQCSNENGELK